MKFAAPLLCAIGLVGSGLASAQANSMKPGLWEISTKMGGNAQMEQAQAQMQQRLASMPPDKRKMMEDMMAKQGVQMGAAAGGGTKLKMCMTKEMAARNETFTQHQGDCKSTTSDRTSSGMKISFSCTNPPSSGEGQISFSGPDAYSMKMTISHTVQGKPEKMTMDSSGQWLSADCGTIKPIVPMMPPKP